MPWRIEFFEVDRNESAARLRADAAAEGTGEDRARADLLEEYGPAIGEPYIKSLAGHTGLSRYAWALPTRFVCSSSAGEKHLDRPRHPQEVTTDTDSRHRDGRTTTRDYGEEAMMDWKHVKREMLKDPATASASTRLWTPNKHWRDRSSATH
jgi:hypothetical protein